MTTMSSTCRVSRVEAVEAVAHAAEAEEEEEAADTMTDKAEAAAGDVEETLLRTDNDFT
jgi:hypothetical protein